MKSKKEELFVTKPMDIKDDYYETFWDLIRDPLGSYYPGIYKYGRNLYICPVEYHSYDCPFEIWVYDFFDDSEEVMEDGKWIEEGDYLIHTNLSSKEELKKALSYIEQRSQKTTSEK